MESRNDQPQEQQCVPDLTSTIQMLQRNEQATRNDQMNVVEDTTYVVEARETRKGKGKGKNRAGMISRPFWQSAEEILKTGMTVRFYQPESVVRKKLSRMIINKIKGEMCQVMDSRVNEYVASGVLIEIPKEEAYFIAPMRIIPRESDPSRPREILDFTELNKYILEADCKLPTRKDLVLLVERYSYAASIDIKSCYTNIKLDEAFQPYCCIGWRSKVYKFTRVPFGIKCAPACCQLVTSHLCEETTIVYLDDFLLLGNSEQQVLSRVRDQVTTLEDRGLPINVTKSILVPQQELEFSGYKLCFGGEVKGVYTTDKHLMDLSLMIKLILTQESVELKTWQRFMGKYNWCRALKEDEKVHSKLVALMNERDTNSDRIVVDHVARAMLSNMVARCSLSFDF